MSSLVAFHLLRPAWLLALIPLAFACVYWWRHYQKNNTWRDLCDAHLLPHLLVDNGQQARRWPIAVLALAWFLAVLALAGPTWKKLPEPVYRQQAARIIVLDLSKSMDASDVTPSRLTRAKFKVHDILKQSREGQTALLVFAAEPFAVTPLSDDAETIAALVPPLATDLMPTQGSRLDLALLKADELLNNAGMQHGEVFLITDGAESLDTAEKATSQLRKHGHRVSVLAIGTQEGAPIPSQLGGFISDESGNTVIARLDIELLQRIAEVGGGGFQTLSNDDSDINALLNSASIMPTNSNETRQVRTTDRWREEGPWLLLALLPLAALAFRRGWLTAGVLLAIITIPQPTYAFNTEDLWLRPDQQGAKALQRGEPEAAAKLFKNPGWQGSAHYRAGQYSEAADVFAKSDDADAHYNRGNALAKAGRLKEALDAYTSALGKMPTHSDAQFNRDVVNKLLKQQKSPNNQEPQQKNPQNNSGAPEHSANSDTKQHMDNQAKDKNNETSKQSSGQNQANKDTGIDTKADNNKDTMKQPGTNKQEDPEQSQQRSSDMAQTQPSQESRQALEQWLRRIPDDPAGLLRRKFMLEHQRRAGQKNSSTPW